MNGRSAKWNQNNARLHALAARVERGGIGAHEVLRLLAEELYGAESVGALTEKQQTALIGLLQREVNAGDALVGAASPRLTNGQRSALRATALYGLGWDAAGLRAWVAKMFCGKKVNDLSPADANRAIQQLNLIKKNR